MKNQTVTQTTNVEEIRHELKVLASIDPDILGPRARKARYERLQALAFNLQTT
jgi:hypothetical protein